MVVEWSEISKIKFSWNKVEDVTQKRSDEKKKKIETIVVW